MQKEEVESLRLCTVLSGVVSETVIKNKNKKKAWDYGYNSDHDIIVISKDGTIGDIVEIQNLRIALPSAPDKVYKRNNKQSEQYWEVSEYPKELSRIKTIFDWNEMPNAFKNDWVDYIEDEFTKRDEGKDVTTAMKNIVDKNGAKVKVNIV